MTHGWIGSRRTLLLIESPAETPDGAGGALVTWVESGSCWARLRPGGGREAQDRDQLAGEIRWEVVLRWREDVGPRNRFRIGQRVLAITSAVDPDGRRNALVCRCVEKQI